MAPVHKESGLLAGDPVKKLPSLTSIVEETSEEINESPRRRARKANSGPSSAKDFQLIGELQPLFQPEAPGPEGQSLVLVNPSVEERRHTFRHSTFHALPADMDYFNGKFEEENANQGRRRRYFNFHNGSDSSETKAEVSSPLLLYFYSHSRRHLYLTKILTACRCRPIERARHRGK